MYYGTSVCFDLTSFHCRQIKQAKIYYLTKISTSYLQGYNIKVLWFSLDTVHTNYSTHSSVCYAAISFHRNNSYQHNTLQHKYIVSITDKKFACYGAVQARVEYHLVHTSSHCKTHRQCYGCRKGGGGTEASAPGKIYKLIIYLLNSFALSTFRHDKLII